MQTESFLGNIFFIFFAVLKVTCETFVKKELKNFGGQILMELLQVNIKKQIPKTDTKAKYNCKQDWKAHLGPSLQQT